MYLRPVCTPAEVRWEEGIRARRANDARHASERPQVRPRGAGALRARNATRTVCAVQFESRGSGASPTSGARLA